MKRNQPTNVRETPLVLYTVCVNHVVQKMVSSTETIGPPGMNWDGAWWAVVIEQPGHFRLGGYNSSRGTLKKKKKKRVPFGG